MVNAQRRPEITPGYDRRRAVVRPARPGVRSTKAGDYPRLRPGTSPRSPTKATTLNEGRRLPPATTSTRDAEPGGPLLPRSTKAGDYPRLRPSVGGRSVGGRAARSTKAGDYPRLRLPAVPRTESGEPAALNEGRRLPPATTRRWNIGARSEGTLNEGRRLPPATTPGPYPFADTAEHRSTKAGDYPRLRQASTTNGASDPRTLNEGRRLPPATTAG